MDAGRVARQDHQLPCRHCPQVGIAFSGWAAFRCTVTQTGKRPSQLFVSSLAFRGARQEFRKLVPGSVYDKMSQEITAYINRQKEEEMNGS